MFSVDAPTCDTDASKPTPGLQDNLVAGNKVFNHWRATELIWLPEQGMGYYPVNESPYDENYFLKYQEYAQTEMGKALLQARLDLVSEYWFDELIDIGIGSGAFVESFPRAKGFDINPHAVNWLLNRNIFSDPYNGEFAAATFWDSLEHIQDPAPILNNIQRLAFISIPIFRNAEHVIASKHFRKDEHYWYFTKQGLINFMSEHGFLIVESSDIETKLGREDIYSFVFSRYR